MCGIFSLLNNTNFIPGNIVSNSFMKGVSRGPEYSELVELYNDVIFGFHRLAINGLDTISNQPMTIDKITLICNGEIYNFKELYNMIEVEPNTNSDCEIIIHLYKKFGIEYTLSLLDGYFSFMIYDASDISNEEPIVYVARDAYGVRPLYILRSNKEINNYDYSNGNKENYNVTQFPIIGFASELKMLSGLLNQNNKTLLYEESSREMNDIKHKYNPFYIEQYPPGTYSKLIKDAKVLSFYNFDFYARKYTTPYVFNNQIEMTHITNYEYNSIFEKVYNTFNDAIKKRVIGTTDRKIACLLSGGLDSSLVAALVAKYSQDEIETYSIGMPGGEDLKYARMVANHIGSKHTEIIVSEEEFLNSIPEVIKVIESYDTTTVRASVGNYLVSKYISNNSDAKVIFNGDGSDELMGGYLYFHAAPDALSFDRETRRLMNDIHYFDVLRSDKSISSNGLEPRTPFLDLHWVNTYFSLPLKFRYNPDKPEKWLLRKSVETMEPDLLPREVLWRTKEAFSDGVSSNKKSWYEIINENVNNIINEKTFEKTFSYLSPQTKEQYYYRTIFESYYPHCEKVVPYFWMPRFIKASDASARTLSIYKNHIQHNESLNSNT
jgi:asparagine synthase (glutamine-hydrolysing)